MRFTHLVLVTLPLLLTACAIPGIVAHSVKSYEHRNDGTPAAEPTAAESQPQPQPDMVRDTPPPPPPEPPPGTTTVPPRDAVSVEPLP